MTQFIVGLLLGFVLAASGSLAWTTTEFEQRYGSHQPSAQGLSSQQQQQLFNMQQQLNTMPHDDVLIPVMPPC